MAIDVAGYLNEQQRLSNNAGQADLADQWAAMAQLYNKKLWHQLTLKIAQFIKHPSMQQGDALVKFYQNFLADFEHRINCLALVEIVLVIITHVSDPKDALEFLEKIKVVVKTSDEATVLCMTAIGNIKLKQADYEESKRIIKETQALLDTLDEVTTVHGRFYELSSNYHMLMGNHADYYRDALRYLGCIDVDEIPKDEQADRAFNLGLAALLGKDVYNFGELLAHKILTSLENTPREWLKDLLVAFNSGDIVEFQRLRGKWGEQLDLSNNAQQLAQKITLLCLMEMTFKRVATDRKLTFAAISQEARIPLQEVELLVMKALSLGLVKGSIDEVDECVMMTWVQPRVLNERQIKVMQDKMKDWYDKVINMEKLVESKAQDILT